MKPLLLSVLSVFILANIAAAYAVTTLGNHLGIPDFLVGVIIGVAHAAILMNIVSAAAMIVIVLKTDS